MIEREKSRRSIIHSISSLKASVISKTEKKWIKITSTARLLFIQRLPELFKIC
jgi:hypothetical protein